MGKLKDALPAFNRREEITVGYKCNLKCRFCFYGCSPKDNLRSYDDIKKDILLAKTYAIEHLELSGGEPMLHPQIASIVEFCRRQGFRTICMITNGTLLVDMERMKTLGSKGLNQLVFSLHGPDSQTHDYLTQTETFDKILKAIENAKRLKIPFRINIVVNKFNFRELTKFSQLVLSLGPIMVNFLIYSPLEIAKEFVSDMSVRYSKMSAEISRAVDIIKQRLEVRIRYIPFCLIKGYEKYICNIHQVHYDLYEWDYILREHIHNGRFYKWVKILVGLFYLPLGRLLSQSIDRSFHEAIIKTMCLVNSYKPLGCRICKYYFICDGLWRDYVSLFGSSEVKPVIGKRITNPAEFAVDWH
ncbi:MAG: radical SAM protein [Candidatus Omnitrophica bacterium]|nr:radical SAM protein [Candidatus Omnitrophota bacterium]